MLISLFLFVHEILERILCPLYLYFILKEKLLAITFKGFVDTEGDKRCLELLKVLSQKTRVSGKITRLLENSINSRRMKGIGTAKSSHFFEQLHIS